MNKELIYILYGSQTGNAQAISKSIYQLLLSNGHNCKYLSLNESIEKETFLFLEKEKEKEKEKEVFPILIIISSTTGNGDAPESANKFWRTIKNRNNPKDLFKNIPFAVLGLGDSNYDKFSQIGKFFDNRLFELGGNRIIELHCADEVSNFEEIVDLFTEKLLTYFKK